MWPPQDNFWNSPKSYSTMILSETMTIVMNGIFIGGSSICVCVCVCVCVSCIVIEYYKMILCL